MERSASGADELVRRVLERVCDRVRAQAADPRATYRLQFHSEYTFRDAARSTGYFRDLGVSHLYASPYFRARSGSRHGYDVCVYEHLNPELGGVEAYRELIGAIGEAGLHHVLDVVPNHMAAAHENPWWWDVLENGPNSPYSGFFDIDWKPVNDELENRVLLPILGAQYGEALESGQLKIEHDEGGFVVRYFSHLLPAGPKTTLPLLTHRIDQLKTTLGAESEALAEYQSILTALEHLPPPTATSIKAVHERQREKEVIKRRLRELEARAPAIAEFVAANVAIFNGTPGEPETFDRLDKLLQAQTYRLCHWRAASDDINYRRFFDVNDLAAICVEKPEVFHAVHAQIGRLLAEGAIAGIRIDHVDGLFAPEEYLWRLQWLYLAHVARSEFDQLAPSPADSLMLEYTSPEGEAVEPNGDARFLDAAAEATDGLPAEAASGVGEPQARRSLGPLVLERVCERLGLPRPKPTDLQAVFGLRKPPRAESTGGERSGGESASHGSCMVGQAPLYVVVEKILGPDEPLPESWPVAGTTGYEYANQLNGLFVRPDGLADMVKQYSRFTGETRPFADIVHDCKRLIVRFSMAGELQVLAHRLNRISEQHRRSRDFTLNALRYALRELLASFPVYRTYPGPDGVSERDRRFVQRAVALAKRRARATDPATFDFIRDVLLLRHPPGLSDAAVREREEFVGRFQQVTSPVMAKGVEDTAFYVYFPLASANEVGGDPTRAANSVAAFHQQNQERAKRQRRGLLATTTHDTKRTEDVRARIDVLTEIPSAWRNALNRFSRLTRRFRVDVEGAPAPSPEDEYLFYQSVVGIWPLERPDDAGLAALVERLQAYMEKATHEAKQRTSWINPHAEYDQAVRKFVADCLTPSRENRFVPALEAFLPQVVDAGLVNALAQTTLKLTSPGVPDIYQGQELWDFSLVDPDNRRPVDYELRARLLGELRQAWNDSPDKRSALARQLALRPRDPRLKLFVTWRLLAVRNAARRLFTEGAYTPLEVRGPAADHVAAFAWSDVEGRPRLIVAVPRATLRLCETAGLSDVSQLIERPADAWRGTELVLPRGGRFVNVFSQVESTTGETDASTVDLSESFRHLPVAVLADAEMGTQFS
jgi:(1->4)-alpha-D-glucan 1-alpha-D-glucosylmutase